MALYRFEAKIVSRLGGRSTVGAAAYRTGKCATAAAAYRAGVAMTDARTGKSFDYSKKRGVLGAEIIAPKGAPTWMRDRERLWNGAEAAEKRHDAQTARDFVISLPHELPHDVRVKLTRAFVREQFVSKGYVADIAWHAPERRGDPRNYHAHVMVTLRRVDDDGFAKKKDRPPGKLHPAKQWKAELDALRKAWADDGAAVLEKAGLHLEAVRFRVGYLTIPEQRKAAIARGDIAWAEELDREAEPKQGPMATKIEREGRESMAGADRRAVKERNAERLKLKAEHAAITAEIIDLQLERIKRGPMDELTDELMAKQSEREAELLEQAKKQEAELVAFRQKREEEAKEARRREDERKKTEAARAREGEISDAKSRYADALGQHYDVRDPYGSLSRAAMAEYGSFHKQQEAYRKQEAAEKDPEKRRLIQLAREIEAHDYMAITSERLAGISRVVGGPDAAKRARAEGRATQAELDDARAEAHKDLGRTRREERSDLIRDMESRDRAKVADQLNNLATKLAGKDGEINDRAAERLGRLQGVGDAYKQNDATRGTRPRGGRSR